MSYVGGGGYESGQSSQAHARGGGYESGQSSQAAGAGGESGEADSDERGEHMQNQMQAEDSSGESGDSEYSENSDEEENDEEMPIPASWNQDFSSAMTVNDGHDSAWQYHQNHMVKGALYPDKQHLQEAITSWAMSTQRVFKTKVSSQKYLTVECRSEERRVGKECRL